MFALGLLSWLYTRPISLTERFLTTKFGAKPELLAANLAALRAGFNYGETTEDFAHRYEVGPAPMPAGHYRNITGNVALAYGLVTAAHRGRSPAGPRAPTRSRRPPTSSTRWPASSGSA